MSYHPPTLSIAIQTVEARLASVKRNYSDTLRQYRVYQDLISDRATQGKPLRGDWAAYLDTYRDRLRSLSYRYRAYTRSIAVLEKEEARS